MTLGEQFYRVAPATPLEGGAFAVPDVVIDLAEREKALRTTDLDDATARLMGHDRETGRRPVGVSPYGSDARTEQEKREKAHQAVLVQVILEQQLREMLDDLYREREQLYTRLTEIHEERQELVRQLDDLQRRDSVAIEFEQRLLLGGLPNRDGNGRFVDERFEALVRRYEARTGQDIDRNNLPDVRRALLEQRQWIAEQQRTRQEGVAALDRESRSVTDGIQRVEERIDKVAQTIEQRGKPGLEEDARDVLGNRYELHKAARLNPDIELDDRGPSSPVDRTTFSFGGGG